MKRAGAVIAIALCILGAFTWVQSREQSRQEVLPNYPTRTARIGDEAFTLLVADTPARAQLGLGAVSKLPRHYGMLFYGQGEMRFWMKGMAYPIDILWLDERGRILHIEYSVSPSTYPNKTFSNPPSTDARMVIEIGAGEAARLNLQVGTKVKIQ